MGLVGLIIQAMVDLVLAEVVLGELVEAVDTAVALPITQPDLVVIKMVVAVAVHSLGKGPMW